MKKIIYSLFVLAMAAFTFSSCEDVPAPYDMPTKPETPELSTDGTEANPYTVADAKIAATGTNVFVKAFIVGYVPDKALNEAIFSDAASAEKAPTNILIAASADETNVTNCMPIQLPAGAIRTALNLKDNPGNLKQEVILCGNIENYFGATGLKSVAYAKIGAKEFGTKPGGSTTTPDTPTDGYINETFNKSFGTFTLKNIKGTPWVIDSYGYAKATGYENTSKVTTPSESYLVSKAIDLSSSKGAALKFSYILRYATYNGEPTEGVKNQVLITENYTGDPATTKWTNITGTLTEGTDWKTWSTYTYDLTPYKGKKNIVIALHYACEAKSGTWEIKELTVKEGTPTVKPETPDTPSTGDTTTPNGDFETWVDGKPNNWKTASTACNATLTQSTDAHNGKYSVKVGGSTTANKRLGYKEMELKAGTYKIKYYVKAATETGASVQSGFVDITAEGKAGNYVYSGYINNIPNTKWTLVEQELVIPADGKYCIVIMNAKKPGGDVLIDNLTLTLGETVIIK